MAFGRRRRRPQNTSEEAVVVPLSPEATLENEVLKARELMGDEIASQVLPEGTSVLRLDKEHCQSPTFRSAAYNMMPERYGNADRSLTTITLETGAQVFIVAGRVSSDNPYEVWHAADGGMDFRHTQVSVYAYGSDETITEYAGGQINTHVGQYATSAAFLLQARLSLGMAVGSETFLAQ